jgi:hypothetical protein
MFFIATELGCLLTIRGLEQASLFDIFGVSKLSMLNSLAYYKECRGMIS